jgi:hypothetical protein
MIAGGGGAASKLGVPSFELLLALPSLPLLATISARTPLEPSSLSVALLKDDMSGDDTAVTQGAVSDSSASWIRSVILLRLGIE